jgi:4-amino-4-deoxy-L-arabinose transferase-like glycosyltransferase
VQTLKRIPTAGRVCFVIAFVNAAIWGVVVPPFQVPDEVVHFAYAQYLAQTGKPPPQGPGAQYSPEEEVAIAQLQVLPVIGHPEERGVLTAPESEAVHTALAAKPEPLGPGGSTAASNQPPLYYALEAIPYWLSPSHDLLTRLALMRLLSALLAGFTVLAVFLFMRELMPRTRWAWSVGALVVAFQPTFDFIAAGVNGDNLLFFASASTFLALLRAYRHGLTLKRGVAIGLAVAIGTLAKLTFIALLPGIALAIALLAWRALPSGRRKALLALGTTVTVAALPVALYAVLNVAVWHRGGGLTAGGLAGATSSNLASGQVVTMRESLDYIWQLYLPRLWFMHHAFFTTNQLAGTWLDGMIGHFGWLDYTFPVWVYKYAEYVAIGFVVLALAGLFRLRRAIRPLLPLSVCFLVMAVGLLASIGYAGVRYQLNTGEQFAQARYLFPLLVFYATFIVLVARALPRRWAATFGALLVVLAMAHGLFAETLTISRYYG